MDFNPCMKGCKNIGRAPASCDMKMRHMKICVGQFIENHGEITINLVRGCGAVMISMFDVIRADA
jgi:hypothetical protein